MTKNTRHICGLSGGKDSSALAIYLKDKIPNMEYFFCDTGAELPETYEYLIRLEIVLGKPIVRLNSDRGFDHYFELYRGTLPSPQMRWCTTNLKIKPIEEWIGTDQAISYVGIRSDESNRKGYISTKKNISSKFPFVEDDIDRTGVLRILDDAGIGLPRYYEWRTRSGCYFCFYQRKAEWVGLAERHPDLFSKAVAIEQKVLREAGNNCDVDFSDHSMQERQYTWSGNETLTELLDRKDQILEQHRIKLDRGMNKTKNLPLIDVLAQVLDDDDDQMQCAICAH